MNSTTKSSFVSEFELISQIIQQKIPQYIDGKDAVLELKNADFQWRQMEWIGWYLEYKLIKDIKNEIGGDVGPCYGNTIFDYQNNFIWDIKSHPKLKYNNQPNEPMILNDKEAIERCIADNGFLGFIIIVGHAEFDTTGEFKLWHDTLKGKTSEYEVERIKRGARSRIRKIGFHVDFIDSIGFYDIDTIHVGIDEGWLVHFQEGLRNSNGTPRRAKYAIKTALFPGKIRIMNPIKIS